MNRVSGWYKRQIQFLLFFLGLIVAVAFNVDTIKIANKLSTDKDAREKIVQLAIVAADKYKDDPRVKKDKNGVIISDSANEVIFNEYKSKLDSVNKLINGDVKNTNQIIALGWGLDTLTRSDSFAININCKPYIFNQLKYKRSISKLNLEFLNELRKTNANLKLEIDTLKKHIQSGSLKPEEVKKENTYKEKQLITLLQDSICSNIVRVNRVDTSKASSKKIMLFVDRKYNWHESVCFVLHNTFKGSIWLGFLITAFAISLGAPFWFDLLNKLIKLRGAGKKEVSDDTQNISPSATPAQVPATTINVNPTQQAGKEAAG